MKTSSRIKLIVIIVMTLGLFTIYYPSFSKSVETSAQETIFNDDVRQYIWPTFVYYGESPFKDDYVADYFFGLMPLGYKATYFIASQFVHPRIISKVLPYILLFLTLVVSTMSSYKLAGAFAGYATLALGLSGSEYILDFTAGGLPRSFMFLPLSIAMYALITKRPFWLVIVTIVSAAFYPPVAIISGVALALYLLLPPKIGGMGTSWSTKHKLFIIGITALFSLVILSQNLVSQAAYGTRINPYNPEQVKMFPEVLDRHRVTKLDREVSLKSIVLLSYISAKSAFQASKNNIYTDYFSTQNKIKEASIILLLFLTLVGSIILWLLYDSAKRLLIMFFSIYICAFLSLILYPLLYFPSRYLGSSLFLLMIVLVPASAGVVFSLIFSRTDRQSSDKINIWMFLSIIIVIVILYIGNKGPTNSGLNRIIYKEDIPVYEFIRSLPQQTVIAGWPKDSVIQNIPYFTNRRVLLNLETHLVFHEKYALEMRHRWKLLVSSYFNLASSSTKKMIQEYGVTHMLLNKEYLNLQVKPEYFSSFTTDINRFMRKIKLTGDNIVFESHNYIIIALEP